VPAKIQIAPAPMMPRETRYAGIVSLMPSLPGSVGTFILASLVADDAPIRCPIFPYSSGGAFPCPCETLASQNNHQRPRQPFWKPSVNDRLRRALELARGGDLARAYDAVLAFRPTTRLGRQELDEVWRQLEQLGWFTGFGASPVR
jgi:hypothetical protein